MQILLQAASDELGEAERGDTGADGHTGRKPAKYYQRPESYGVPGTVSKAVVKLLEVLTKTEEFMSVEDVGELVGMNPSTVRNYMGNLSYQGWIQKKRSHRSILVRLTSKGMIECPEYLLRAQQLKNPDQPPCFPSKELWDEWCLYARRSDWHPASFCVDCTPEYKGQMVYEGKCIRPDTRFVYSPTGSDRLEIQWELIGINRAMRPEEKETPPESADILP